MTDTSVVVGASEGAPRGRGQRPGIASRPPNPNRRLRSILLKTLELGVITVALLATALVSALISFTLAVRGNDVSVPELTGSSLAGAESVLARSELKLRQEGNRFDEAIPPDFIAAQEPAAGAQLKKGRSVRVWVSLGPERRVVPRVEGESLQSARLILEQDNFALGRVVEVHSELYAPDTVIAQDPPPFEDAGESQEVDVLLSRGYLDDAYVMPDFIGHDYADVLDRVRRGSLRISRIQYVDYPGVGRGTVVRQSPRAGTKVFKRDTIVIYVSKG